MKQIYKDIWIEQHMMSYKKDLNKILKRDM